MEPYSIDRDVFFQVFVRHTSSLSQNEELDSYQGSDSWKILLQQSDRVSIDLMCDYMDNKLNELCGCTTNVQSVSESLMSVHREMGCLLGPNRAYVTESVNRDPPTSVDEAARLGPRYVQLDSNVRCGLVHQEAHTGRLTSRSAFTSVRGDVCVFSGKWQYEVMLDTAGIMQIGWAHADSKFSGTCGVGDTQLSFAYDGQRKQRWNKSCSSYGEQWQVGDVIGVCIDLDAGCIRYLRNGRDLSIAFYHIPTGPGFAYFPALSMAKGESVCVNFGIRPFRYPMFAHNALHLIDMHIPQKANLLLEWLFNLVLLSLKNTQLDEICVHLIAHHVLERLGPLFSNAYVVDACLLKHLLLYYTDSEIHSFLELIWTLLDKAQVALLLKNLIIAITAGYLYSPVYDADALLCQLHCAQLYPPYESNERNPFYTHQRQHLLLLLTLLQHAPTRTQILEELLFEQHTLLRLLDVKLEQDEVILRTYFFPKLNEKSAQACFGLCSKRGPASRYSFWQNTQLENAISQLHTLHTLLLDVLLFQDEHCRRTFIIKLTRFVRDERHHANLANASLHGRPFTSPAPSRLLLSLFRRLLALVRTQYVNVITHIPVEFFLCGSLIPSEQARLGGLCSHLFSTYAREVSNVQAASPSDNPLLTQVYQILNLLLQLYPLAPHKQFETLYSAKEPLANLGCALQSLLRSSNDNAIRSARVLSEELTRKCGQFGLVNLLHFNSETREDIVWLLSVQLSTLEQASNLGCMLSFLPDYHLDACLSLSFALRFFFANEALVCSGSNPLLQYSRPYKIESGCSYEKTLASFACFVASHVYDERIALADQRALISHALGSLLLYETSMRVLENISIEKRLNLIKRLTAPYEGAPWVDSNWILLRFWKGCGFAYQCNRYDSLLRARVVFEQKLPLCNMNNLPPLYSHVFQRLLADYFHANARSAHAFVGSLLGKLNWTFSQCISTLQEIQAYAANPERANNDCSSARLCVTCFRLCVALLRVLEMIVHHCPQRILVSMENLQADGKPLALACAYDKPWEECNLNELLSNIEKANPLDSDQLLQRMSLEDRDNEEEQRLNAQAEQEVLLRQLCSIINQVLNRVSMSGHCFPYVQQLAGVQMISQISIISAVLGVLVQLIVRGSERIRKLTLCLLVRDPSFQLSSYLYVIGGETPRLKRNWALSQTSSKTNNETTEQRSVFHLYNYIKELRSNEYEQVIKLLIYVSRCHERNEKCASIDDIADDDMCTICYAQRKTAHFVPCNHQSCRTCITMHFMSQNQCFFCKSDLEKVYFDDSSQILYPKNEKESS